MKTLLTFTLVMSMFLTGFADPTNKLAVLSKVSIHDQKAKVVLREGIGKVKISVKNINGKTLFYTYHNVTKDVVMPFNLENLPPGKYLIRIETKELSFDYEVETKAKAAINTFKANVKAIDNRYVKVALYEILEEGTFTIKVFDESNRLIYRDKVIGGPFARNYNFRNFTTTGKYLSITDSKGNSQFFPL